MASRKLSGSGLALLLAAQIWASGAWSAKAQRAVVSTANGRLGWNQATEPVYGPGVPESADAVIVQMSAAAGVIFAGQVLEVRRPTGFAESGQDAADGIVEVDFLVRVSVRGVAPGSLYTLREWAGLWSGNGSRYRVGEQALIFLYEPDAHGLSSPVHGAEGIVPLRGGGVAPGSDDNTSAAAEWMVDLRWLQAQALRRASIQSFPVRTPIRPRPIHGFVPAHEDERAGEVVPVSFVRRAPDPSPSPAVPVIETEPLAQVLDLCRRTVRRTRGGIDATR